MRAPFSGDSERFDRRNTCLNRCSQHEHEREITKEEEEMENRIEFRE